MSVDATASQPVPMVEGWLSAEALADVAEIESVAGVVPVLPPLVQAWPGAKVSEGDAARGAGRSGDGGDGQRRRGRRDVGFDQPRRPRGGGVEGERDLPANVQVVADGAAGSTDEGRAMAEIIYDLAPGMSKLVFATANGGPASKAQRITAMADAGAQVIADDTTYLSKPFFQDGVVSQAIDGVKARGVAYFASAGNQARASWEGTFKPTNGGAAGPTNFHDFGSTSVDQDQRITIVPPGGSLTVYTQWDEPWGATVTDLDSYFVDPVAHVLLGGDQSDNLQLRVPLAAIVQEQRRSGARDRLRRQSLRRHAHSVRQVHDRQQLQQRPADRRLRDELGNIAPDSAGAKGALAVAAVAPNDPGTNDPETFSSRGPLRRLFDKNGVRLGTPEVRNKPEIAAADRVSTTDRASRRSPARSPRRRTRPRSQR